jgi:mono/diheme cytochrome c family protein
VRRFAPIALAVLALAVAGCGGAEEVAPLPETIEGTVPTETTEEVAAAKLEGDPAKGEGIYASAGCGGCHTMAAAGSTGTVGPNLDEAKPSFEDAAAKIAKGGGGMPAFEGQLSDQEIADVAAYVAENAGKS